MAGAQPQDLPQEVRLLIGPWGLDAALPRACDEGSECDARLLAFVQGCAGRGACSMREAELLARGTAWVHGVATCAAQRCYCNTYVFKSGSTCTEATRETYLNSVMFPLLSLIGVALAVYGAYPLVVLRWHGSLSLRASESACLLAVAGGLSLFVSTGLWFSVHFADLPNQLSQNMVVGGCGLIAFFTMAPLMRLSLTWVELAHGVGSGAVNLRLMRAAAYATVLGHSAVIAFIVLQPETNMLLLCMLNIGGVFILSVMMLFGCIKMLDAFQASNPEARAVGSLRLLWYAFTRRLHQPVRDGVEGAPRRTAASSSLSTLLFQLKSSASAASDNGSARGGAPFATGTSRRQRCQTAKDKQQQQQEQHVSAPPKSSDMDMQARDFAEVQSGFQLFSTRIFTAAARTMVIGFVFVISQSVFCYALIGMKFVEDPMLAHLMRVSLLVLFLCVAEALRTVLWFFRKSYKVRMQQLKRGVEPRPSLERQSIFSEEDAEPNTSLSVAPELLKATSGSMKKVTMREADDSI